MLVTVIDNALPEALFRKLWRQVRDVGIERLRQSHWTTFWYDFGSPATIVDRAALALRDQVGDFGAGGVEWWLGRVDLRRVPIGPHADRDNHLFDATGRRCHPIRSTVLYFNRVQGGALLVRDQRESPDGARLIPARVRDEAVVAPRRNRVAHFAGDRVHAVLDARNEVPGRPLDGPKQPLRYSLILNSWKRPPRGVRPWNGRIYPALAAVR